MSVNLVNQTDASLAPIAGATLYADEPIGAILPFGGSTVPNGFLLCNGAAVSRTTYAALFAVIGTSFGVGDGSTTFNIPDFRELVPVGAGQNATQTIATHDTYTVGEFKDDQFQSHVHNTHLKGHMTTSSGDAWCTAYDQEVTGTRTTSASTDTGFTPREGTTTHGKQLGVNYIIKATSIALPSDFEDAFKRESIVVAGTSSNGVLFERSNNVVCVQLNGIDAPTLIAATIPEKLRPKRQVLTTGTLVHTGLSNGYMCYIWFYPNGTISGAYNNVGARAENFSTQSDWAIFGSTSWII